MEYRHFRNFDNFMKAYLNQDESIENLPSLLEEYKEIERLESIEQLINDVESILFNINWNHLQNYIQQNYDGRTLTTDEVRYLLQTILEVLR